MSNLKIASTAAALLIVANGALADPLRRERQGQEDACIVAGGSNHGQCGYYVPYVVGVDGKKYPIMEIPGNVTVISRQLMDDQQATTLGDALRNVSGVTVRGR